MERHFSFLLLCIVSSVLISSLCSQVWFRYTPVNIYLTTFRYVLKVHYSDRFELNRVWTSFEYHHCLDDDLELDWNDSCTVEVRWSDVNLKIY